MKEKLAIFPYSNEISCLWKYSDLIRRYEIKYLISPKGWGLTGQEISLPSQEQNVIIKIQDEFNGVDANNVDAVWITEEINKIDQSVAIKILDKFLNINIKVLYTTLVCSDIKDIIIKSGFSINLSEIENKEIKSVPAYYQCDFNVPVIMVLGTSIMTEKFELQLNIKRELQDKGYKVSHVGTKSFSNLFESHPIPDWFFGRKYNEAEKISMFNKYLKDIETHEKPDIIIVGIPESIMPLTHKHPFNYGVYAFEICCAVLPDYAILSLPYGEYNNEFYEEMERLCRYRLNVKLDAFYISEYQPISISLKTPKLEFVKANGKILKDVKYVVFGKSDNSFLGNHIVKKLSLYGEYQII